MNRDINSILDTLKKTIDTTMDLEAKRFNESYGWVNTKVYPLTGLEKNDKNHIITLIQGRALEAITEHLDFYKHQQNMDNPNLEVLYKQGTTLYKKIDKLVSDYRHVPLHTDANGKATSEIGNEISMNDLFCSKGLYAWNVNYRTKEETEIARDSLFCKVEETLTCNSGIFEDRMVGISAMSLILKYEQKREAFELGKRLVDYIFEKHYNSGQWPYLPYGAITYFIDEDDKPLIKDGKLAFSPGDNMQFAGLTSQFILRAKELSFITEEDKMWMDNVADKLTHLIDTCYELSFVEKYGFHMWTDGLTGNPIDSRMGWWEVAEAMRGDILTSSITKRNSDVLFEKGLELMDIFQKQYVSKSPIGIAVQQLEPDGSAVKTVPNNPDIDAGYHTGLTHIAVFNLLSKNFV